MLRDESFEGGSDDNAWSATASRHNWQDIDHALRELARCRAALDADEARLLCIAIRAEVWRAVGKGSLLEYLEDVLGHSPRNARERVRVAKALDEMPELADALATGVLHWSAVREITRVATPLTVDDWIAGTRDKNLRQIEELVSCRKKGDRPGDPGQPSARKHKVTLELDADAFALLRQARQALADERGGSIDESELVVAACTALLESGGDEDGGRAKYQVMMVLCPSCRHAEQEAAGRRIAVDEATRERAECDAQWIGTDSAPERATQDVTPMVRRFVHRRDAGKCCVPTCRASRFLAIHHIVPRAAGGSHEPENLTLLCGGHHRALHDGKLTISGTAPDLVVTWAHAPSASGAHPETARGAMSTEREWVARNRSTHERESAPRYRELLADRDSAGRPPTTHVGRDRDRSRFEIAKLVADAKQALVGIGFSKTGSHDAVTSALDELGDGATIERLCFEAIRRCKA
jgi:5-methylcytosine-specific restriction endonuclease McrA